MNRSSSEPAPLRFRTWRDAEAHLLSFINYERTVSGPQTTRTHDLREFRANLLRAGWVPDSVPHVHVGGTNGKGTVSHLIERILRSGGLRTGLYTSPHLESMRERILLDGKPIGARAFRDGTAALTTVFAGGPGAGFRTTFEHLTALAWLAFQDHRAQQAIVEVGLGGRLDATNVLPPGMAVITPISMDHQRVLGDSVSAIAADKARILKPGGRGFILPQPAEAARVIRRHAARSDVPLTFTTEAVEIETDRIGETGSVFCIRGRRDYGRISTRLLGAHQTENVAAAVSVAEAILPKNRLRAAVTRGLRGARVPGRMHRVRWGSTVVLLDGGHNPAAATAVVRALKLHYDRPFVAVVGMARDKNHAEYLRVLAEGVDRILFTSTDDNPRAADPRALLDAAPRGVPAAATSSVGEALRRGAGHSDHVLVAGSFHLLGDAFRWLRENGAR